jgi:CRISPR-associated protein Cmr2
MGKWLAGEGLPSFQKAFHPDVVGKFSEMQLGTDSHLVSRLTREGSDVKTHAAQWEQILKAPRPLSAALHNSLSLALANFALECTRQVVEGAYLGRVVYAGGDDLMALLPAEYALAAARDLRALYSGQATVEIGPDGWRVTPDFQGDSSGFLQVEETMLLTMGPTATASAGVAIAHHQAPLDGVLAAAREAEHAAKETYNRNAVCVYALKRSGEALRVGGRWHCRGRDLIGQIEDLRSLFAQDLLSSKFAYELHREARVFPRRVYEYNKQTETGRWRPAGPPWRAWRGAIHRLVKRHWQGDREQQEAEASRLAECLAFFTVGLSLHRFHWEPEWWRRNKREPDPVDEDFAPQPGPVELGKWLLLARFLETGGEE